MKLYVLGLADDGAGSEEPPVEALRMLIAAHKTFNPQSDWGLPDANAFLTATADEPQVVGESDDEDAIIECETALAGVGILTERDWEAIAEAVESDREVGPSYTACQLALLTLKHCSGNPLNAFALLIEQRNLIGGALAPVNAEAARVLADTFDITAP